MQPREEHAVVESIERMDGVVRLAVRFDDGRVERADLRPDLVAGDLAVGQSIGVTKAALYRRWHVRALGA